MTPRDEDLTEQVRKIVSRPYHRLITGEPDEGYLGEVLELPGCVTAGETPEEALLNLREAMEVWVETALSHGEPVPEPMAGRVGLLA